MAKELVGDARGTHLEQELTPFFVKGQMELLWSPNSTPHLAGNVSVSVGHLGWDPARGGVRLLSRAERLPLEELRLRLEGSGKSVRFPASQNLQRLRGAREATGPAHPVAGFGGESAVTEEPRPVVIVAWGPGSGSCSLAPTQEFKKTVAAGRPPSYGSEAGENLITGARIAGAEGRHDLREQILTQVDLPGRQAPLVGRFARIPGAF
nr:uncharacterized protein LOC127487351 [Oryctolagus cuniculus]